MCVYVCVCVFSLCGLIYSTMIVLLSVSPFMSVSVCVAMQKEMAAHSSVLAWRIPGAVEPGGLPSMGLHRVGHG